MAKEASHSVPHCPGSPPPQLLLFPKSVKLTLEWLVGVTTILTEGKLVCLVIVGHGTREV